MAERFCRERGVKFSVVFVTVRFRIVFSEKAESNFALSAVYSVFKDAELCVFGKYAERNRDVFGEHAE
jgi:hypothetical protein